MGTAAGLNSQPRVSVIVPTRNRRVLLRQLLDGLARQSYTDFEAIVVDDGSSDGSSDEVEEVSRGGRPFRVLRTEGIGAVGARLAGVAAASGDYLAFTDDDCVPDEEWLEAGVASLDAGADVVQGVTRAAGPVRPLDRTVMVDRHDGLYNTCNVFYRRSAYCAAGGFDAGAGPGLGFRPDNAARALGFGEDALLGWRVRRAGRAAFAPDAVVAHHVFPPDPRDALRRAWMSGAFPALVREIPELRDTALAHRYFLGTRRIPLYAAVALLLCRAPRAAAASIGVWAVRYALANRSGSSARRLAAGAVGDLAIDATITASLVVGSTRARRLVL